MTKIVSALGLMVALSLGAIAWTGSDVTAHAGVAPAAGSCAPGQVAAFDEGYGVTNETACVDR